MYKKEKITGGCKKESKKSKNHAREKRNEKEKNNTLGCNKRKEIRKKII